MNERSYDTPTPKAEPSRPQGSFWGEIIRFALITVIIVIPVRTFIAQPFIVAGASMDPTFADGEYLIVDQISRRISEPKRESVIIFKYPNDTSKFFIKRVIGLPGETVEIEDGKITIFFPTDSAEHKQYPNGFVLDEPYIAENNKKTDDLTFVLNNGEYFVLGDNRLGSLDSRAWGPVPEDLIIGRPLIRLLPIHKLNFLPGDNSSVNDVL